MLIGSVCLIHAYLIRVYTGCRNCPVTVTQFPAPPNRAGCVTLQLRQYTRLFYTWHTCMYIYVTIPCRSYRTTLISCFFFFSFPIIIGLGTDNHLYISSFGRLLNTIILSDTKLHISIPILWWNNNHKEILISKYIFFFFPSKSNSYTHFQIGS